MTTAVSSSTAPSAALAAAGTTTTGGATANASGSEDRFLKLLVAQLNNQDPMNPMDNAQMTSQMAQISTVTGVQQVTKSIQDLAAQLASMQMLQSSSLVGRNVLVDGSKLPVRDGKAGGAIDLVTAADSVKVEVLSAGGHVIDTLDLGALPAGRSNFDWNATGKMANGTASYRVTATQAGKPVSATTYARDSVDSISTDGGAMAVQLHGLGSQTYDRLKAIL